MPLRLDNAKSVAHMPTAEQQQTKKDFKPRFKVDPAASPMPEIRLPERLATGRHQNRNAGRDHLGIPGRDRRNRQKMVATWRAAIVAQLLTPAPTAREITWKRAVL